MTWASDLEGQGHICSPLLLNGHARQNQFHMINALQEIMNYVHLHYDLDLEG